MHKRWLRERYDNLQKGSYDKRFWLLILLVGGLPCILLLGLIICFAVNVPFWDQWELVPLIQKYHAGTLGFSDLFAQHNEHRLLFPRLLMLALASISHWNTLWEVITSVLIAATGFGFLYLILARTLASKVMLLVATALISLIFFSPVQIENWLWGWQVQWYLNILGLIVAVWALAAWRTEKRYNRLGVAAIAAVVSTFSLASGFFVWIVCLPLIVCNKKLRPLTVLWLALMAAALAAYYIGYQDPAYQPSKSLFLHEPQLFVRYFLTYIGRPLTPDFLLSIPIALAFLAASAVSLGHLYKTYRAELTGSLLPWLCLGTYGLIAAATTAISRVGYGLEQAYSSRYITLSNFFLVAVVVIVFKLIERLRKEGRGKGIKTSRAYMVLLIVATTLVMANYGKGIVQMKIRNTHLNNVQHCLLAARSAQDACLLLAYPNKDIVWERLQYLRQVHWGGL